MARFDFYEYNPAHTPYVLDVQADFFEHLKTRIVIPLRPYSKNSKESGDRLKPTVTIKGKKYLLMTPDMASIHISNLGKKAGSLKDDHFTIIDSIDFLLQGF